MASVGPGEEPRIESVEATVMFAGVVGFTALSERVGVEEAYRLVTGCLQLLDTAVRRHGGAVDKYMGDALIAVFGHPLKVERPEASAVRASLEMQAVVRDYNRELDIALPIGLSIGMNTGSMIAGDAHGAIVREFNVLGDSVNTAARIKSKAPVGHVFVGASTRSATEELFRYEALAPMAMKGKAEPVPVFDLVGPLPGIEAEAGAELTPLSPVDARRLVDSLIADAEVDEETRRLIVERGAGNPLRLALGVHLSEVLRSERERAGSEEERPAETERRRSTVLFADITGFTAMSEQMKPEEAYPIVTGCLAILDGIARKHGGTVDKYMGDCVLALYGVPKAIEDAPRAAINAAIEMVQAVRRYSDELGLTRPLDVHVGVNTGLGIAGDISGPLLREFAVMGDSVTTAELLCDRAERGEIFAGPETWRQTRDDFEFAEPVSVEIKGREAPIEGHELRSRTQRLHRARAGASRRVSTELVGRESQLEQLAAALERLRRGEGGIITIVADAGVGKSRLVAEIAGSEAARGCAWLEGRSLSTGQQLSFHPFADMYRSWAEIDDSDDEEASRTKLQASVSGLLGERSDEILPFLAILTGLQLGELQRERLARIEGESLEKLIRAGVMELLSTESERSPVVVLLDDLHWADQSSIELLEALLRLAEQHAILFLNVCRPGFASTSERVRAHARAQHPDRADEIELRPLDAGAARRMVKSLFREGDLPQTTRALIEEKAQGNPFYIEEVVRSLLDQDAVVEEDGHFVATEGIHDVEIPGTVQEVVMARVDRLEQRKRQHLQVASVIGQSFPRIVLEAIRGDVEALRRDLAELCEAEFLVVTDRLPGEEFAFKHPLIQEVTYDSILLARREELHHSVAASIEDCLPEQTPGYDAMLAYHFSMGRDADRAETYLFRAGDEAARIAASSEALHFFREASKLYLERHGEGGDPSKKALLEKNVALALLNRGEMLDAVEHFDRATEFLGARISRKPAPMALRFAWNLASVLGALYLPLPHRTRPVATELQQEVFDLMFRRAMAQSTAAPTRFFSDCMELLRALSKVEPSSVPEAAAMYSGAIGIFSYSGLSFGVSRRFLDIASDLASAGAVDQRVLYWRAVSYLHHLLEGDWGPEHEIEAEAIEEGLQDGWFWEASSYINWDAMKHLARGSWAGVAERIEQLLKIADRYEHDLSASAHRALTAFLHVERRELPEALEAIELYYDEANTPVLNLNALGTRAKVEVLQGDLDAAEATLARAHEVLAVAGRAAPYHASSTRIAELALDLARLEESLAAPDVLAASELRGLRKHLERSQAQALAAASKVAYRRPEALRLAARADWALGRQKRARERWREALGCCERLGARPELARTLADIGRALVDTPGGSDRLEGRSATDWLAEADRLYGELELHWDRERLQRVSPIGSRQATGLDE